MKKSIVLLLMLLTTIISYSQPRPKRFDPKRFEIEIRQYITTEAGLTPMEAAAFFPIYEEMQQKQRILFEKMRSFRFVDTSDNKASLQAIKQMDAIDLEMKKMQRDYHLKFCKVLPPGKVLEVLKADERFHRKTFMGMFKKQK